MGFKRHLCLLDGCPEVVPGKYITCVRHWALADPELKKDLRAARGGLAIAVALARLLGDLHSRAELMAVPPPPDHDPQGFLAACCCQSCTGAICAAVACRGLEEWDWVRRGWARMGPDQRLGSGAKNAPVISAAPGVSTGEGTVGVMRHQERGVEPTRPPRS